MVVVLRYNLTWHATSGHAEHKYPWWNDQEYEDRSPPRAREDSMPVKEEEKEVVAPEPELPEPEELPPPPPPEPAPEPVGDLLVGSMQWIFVFDECRSTSCLGYQLPLVLATLRELGKSGEYL